MSNEFYNKWQGILEDVEKSKIPIQFLKKIILKFQGKKQQTINIQSLLKQGLEPEEVEEIVNRKLIELDHQIVNIVFNKRNLIGFHPLFKKKFYIFI